MFYKETAFNKSVSNIQFFFIWCIFFILYDFQPKLVIRVSYLIAT